ncbi:MAG: hypothetical protein U5L11_12405 [Arhodomonas sp.]|nr:hypothetical protein [Arhodomonas sp.]
MSVLSSGSRYGSRGLAALCRPTEQALIEYSRRPISKACRGAEDEVLAEQSEKWVTGWCYMGLESRQRVNTAAPSRTGPGPTRRAGSLSRGVPALVNEGPVTHLIGYCHQ